jgi:hypothetical protein
MGKIVFQQPANLAVIFFANYYDDSLAAQGVNLLSLLVLPFLVIDAEITPQALMFVFAQEVVHRPCVSA